MKSYAMPLIALMMISATTQLYAGPGRHYSYDRTSIGFRAGWVGAPNGLTIRKVVGNGSAFEFVGGYNHKYARRTELPLLRKGNSFLGASYAPFFLVSEGNIGVALTADIGARLNFHHYRTWSNEQGVSKITPEAIGGLGMQVEFSEKVEIFADVHLKYFNEPHGSYVPGIESGMGIRFALH
jgi:hypothetical protein